MRKRNCIRQEEQRAGERDGGRFSQLSPFLPPCAEGRCPGPLWLSRSFWLPQGMGAEGLMLRPGNPSSVRNEWAFRDLRLLRKVVQTGPCTTRRFHSRDGGPSLGCVSGFGMSGVMAVG